MEGSKPINVGENGSSSEGGRPPNPLAGGARPCFGVAARVTTPSACKKTLVRHQSLVKTKTCEVSVEPILSVEGSETEFIPVLRSGAWADVGFRSNMEDVYVCADNFMRDYGVENIAGGPSAFYGVFDGHGGKHAADFACYHLPRFIVEDDDFPGEIERAIASAFMQTDNAFAKACSLDAALDSGTTALAAFVIGSVYMQGWQPFWHIDELIDKLHITLSGIPYSEFYSLSGSSLVVANAGDCRAVLCRRGKAIEMSRDHKPICSKERKRIEACGGYVYDGYLNGQLNVARALGDWHMEGLKLSDGGPLSSEPELMNRTLTDEDEFLIMGCDGIWDVFLSQNAVDFARRRLQEHNDPILCSKDLVDEALKRKSGDNLAVVVVCFQSQPPPNLVAPRGRVQRSISAEGLKELQSFLDSLGN
ncbi:hypothetical protein RJ639_012985 [Escallonia herrerae]|uniref:protein-serine/threonine phosphatase n=1 Tax=Escallonia herrerae TaxID=1293975 RepID=A0AA88VJ63_9ASTE|nr:hypothetical protein RJ639_012985 [Escallonia herrerae]